MSSSSCRPEEQHFDARLVFVVTSVDDRLSALAVLGEIPLVQR